MTVFTSHFTNGWLATIGAFLGTAVLFLFGSSQMFYIFIGFFVLDAVTGVIAAIVKKKKVTSKRWRDSVYKLLAYLSVILVAASLGLVFSTMTWILGAALGWVILGEGVSILENSEVILGKRIPFLAKIKGMLDALKGNNKIDNKNK